MKSKSMMIMHQWGNRLQVWQYITPHMVPYLNIVTVLEKRAGHHWVDENVAWLFEFSKVDHIIAFMTQLDVLLLHKKMHILSHNSHCQPLFSRKDIWMRNKNFYSNQSGFPNSVKWWGELEILLGKFFFYWVVGTWGGVILTIWIFSKLKTT